MNVVIFNLLGLMVICLIVLHVCNLRLKNCANVGKILDLLDGKYLGSWNMKKYISNNLYTHLTPKQYVQLYIKCYNTDKEFHTLPISKRKKIASFKKIALCRNIISEFDKLNSNDLKELKFINEAIGCWNIDDFIYDENFEDDLNAELYMVDYLAKFKTENEFHTNTSNVKLMEA